MNFSDKASREFIRRELANVYGNIQRIQLNAQLNCIKLY